MNHTRLLTGVVLALVVIGGLLAVPIAEERALGAEERYVSSQLEDASCLGSWGTNEGTVSRAARITGVTASGLRVSVTLPYAYMTERDGQTIHADTASEAVYAVSLTGTRRVSGDTISPC